MCVTVRGEQGAEPRAHLIYVLGPSHHIKQLSNQASNWDMMGFCVLLVKKAH